MVPWTIFLGTQYMQLNNGLENHQISSQELHDNKRYFKRRRTHIWELVISSTEFLYFEIRFLKLKHHNDEIKISVLGLIPTSAFIYKHTNIFYISIDHLSFSKLAGIHADCDCNYSSNLYKTIWVTNVRFAIRYVVSFDRSRKVHIKDEGRL